MHPAITIRVASEQDMPGITAVLTDAFGGHEEAGLVTALLDDPSASPVLSLVAHSGETILGHILFTRASLQDSPRITQASILAPLAVATHAQGQGIGGKLIQEGLKRLAERDIGLVFVLGYPGYYTRHGFRPAFPLGFVPPYPIPDKDADAWMVQALKPDVTGSLQGRIVCANALDKAEYWLE